jgi:formylglycine-generating enzyme required for sulfatase activity
MSSAVQRVPRAFVSHTSLDVSFCRPYVETLRSYGIDVWYDEHDLGSGRLASAISNELSSREHFIVILSPAALNSIWVANEYGAALALDAQGKLATLLPIIVEPCEVPAILLPYKRIEAKGSGVLSVAEAAARTVALLTDAHNRDGASDDGFLPEHLPTTLKMKGFQGRLIDGHEVIVPPTVPIAAGPFVMGSDDKQSLIAWQLPSPMHMFYLPGYAMGIYPVTVAEYACFLRVNSGSEIEPRPSHRPLNDSTWQSQLAQVDHPVVNITWYQAVSYANWLSNLTQETWRLPTEAEWEKAARGTDRRLYPWGSEWDISRANTKESRLNATTPVGHFSTRGESPYRVQDMAGNVLEWCSSLYREYPYWSDDGREDMNSFGFRVLRGGSWHDDHPLSMTVARISQRPDYAHYAIGFRLLSES